MKHPFLTVISLSCVLTAEGCSYYDLNNAAYSTLRAYGQQQCERSGALDCNDRESYNQTYSDYQHYRDITSSPETTLSEE